METALHHPLHPHGGGADAQPRGRREPGQPLAALCLAAGLHVAMPARQGDPAAGQPVAPEGGQRPSQGGMVSSPRQTVAGPATRAGAPAAWAGWFGRYLTTLQAAVVVLLLVGYPNLLTHLNPAPELAATARIHGVVLSAHSRHPNVRLQLADGHIVDLDFPGTFDGIYFERTKPFSQPVADELHRLAGCATELRVDQPRFTLAPVNARIWDLQCEHLRIPFEELRRHHQQASAITAGQAFIWLLAASIVLAAFLRDLAGASRANAAVPAQRWHGG